MKVRHLRCDDPTWKAALDRAKSDGLPLSEVVRAFLEAYGSNQAPARTFAISALIQKDGLT
jgi:hypothetical protein